MENEIKELLKKGFKLEFRPFKSATLNKLGIANIHVYARYHFTEKNNGKSMQLCIIVAKDINKFFIKNPYLDYITLPNKRTYCESIDEAKELITKLFLKHFEDEENLKRERRNEKKRLHYKTIIN